MLEVYAIRCKASRLIKVGFSSNLENRLADLDNVLSLGSHSLGRMPGGMREEQELHSILDRMGLRVRREWFSAACYSTVRDHFVSHGGIWLGDSQKAMDSRSVGMVRTAEQTPGQTAEATREATHVLGYRLTRKMTSTKGRSYERWYARKGDVWIYLGADTQGAEAKIRAWLSKHASEQSPRRG